MKIRIYDITWDTDGENVDLPAEVLLDPVKEGMTDIAEEGADWLSDRFGWCVKDFSFEPAPRGTRKVFAIEMDGNAFAQGVSLDDPNDPVARALQQAIDLINAHLSANNAGPAMLDLRDVTQEVEFCEKIAHLDKSEDKLIREAIQDYGMETVPDIKDHLASGQLDGDWYSSQSDALDALITEARRIGGKPCSGEDAAIREHPDFKALSLAEDMDGPDF